MPVIPSLESLHPQGKSSIPHISCVNGFRELVSLQIEHRHKLNPHAGTKLDVVVWPPKEYMVFSFFVFLFFFNDNPTSQYTSGST